MLRPWLQRRLSSLPRPAGAGLALQARTWAANAVRSLTSSQAHPGVCHSLFATTDPSTRLLMRATAALQSQPAAINGISGQPPRRASQTAL
jgi:hypothetical protein